MKFNIQSALQWESGIKSFYGNIGEQDYLISWHQRNLQTVTTLGKRIEGTANKVKGASNGVSIVKGKLEGLADHDLSLIKEHAMDGEEALALIDGIKRFEASGDYDKNVLAISDDGYNVQNRGNSSLTGEDATVEFKLMLAINASNAKAWGRG